MRGTYKGRSYILLDDYVRHAERNRLAFCLSVYGGCRVGEISAIKICDAVNEDGKARAEIKLAATQTKGNKGRVVYVRSYCQIWCLEGVQNSVSLA